MSVRGLFHRAIPLLLVLLASPAPVRADGAPSSDLMRIYRTLSTRTFVDLTHSFDSDIPHWKGFDALKVRDVYTIDKDGFYAQEFCHVG